MKFVLISIGLALCAGIATVLVWYLVQETFTLRQSSVVEIDIPSNRAPVAE